MSLRFVVTDHAFDRFVERAELDNPESAEYRELLLAELERGVPFGGQVATMHSICCRAAWSPRLLGTTAAGSSRPSSRENKR